MKSKRNQKSLEKNEEIEEKASYMIKCNLIPDIQKTMTPKICLDFDAVEMSSLNLIERA